MFESMENYGTLNSNAQNCETVWQCLNGFNRKTINNVETQVWKQQRPNIVIQTKFGRTEQLNHVWETFRNLETHWKRTHRTHDSPNVRWVFKVIQSCSGRLKPGFKVFSLERAPPRSSDFGITMRMGIAGGNPTGVSFGTNMLECSW